MDCGGTRPGVFARAVMPGPDPLGRVGAIALAIGAALLGGVIGTVAGGSVMSFDFRSLLMAVIGSLLRCCAIGRGRCERRIREWRPVGDPLGSLSLESVCALRHGSRHTVVDLQQATTSRTIIVSRLH